MAPRDYLTTATLIDCTGRVSHRLTLHFDGLVTIEFASGRATVVDPSTRTVLTPGIHVDEALMDQAAALRP